MFSSEVTENNVIFRQAEVQPRDRRDNNDICIEAAVTTIDTSDRPAMDAAAAYLAQKTGVPFKTIRSGGRRYMIVAADAGEHTKRFKVGGMISHDKAVLQTKDYDEICAAIAKEFSEASVRTLRDLRDIIAPMKEEEPVKRTEADAADAAWLQTTLARTPRFKKIFMPLVTDSYGIGIPYEELKRFVSVNGKGALSNSKLDLLMYQIKADTGLPLIRVGNDQSTALLVAKANDIALKPVSIGNDPELSDRDMDNLERIERALTNAGYLFENLRPERPPEKESAPVLPADLPPEQSGRETVIDRIPPRGKGWGQGAQ